MTIPVAHAIFAGLAGDYESRVSGLAWHLALSIPYLCLGMTIACLMVARSETISRAYAVNLAGSGLGCLIVFPLLDLVGAERALVVIAAMVGPSAQFWGRFGVHNNLAWSGVPALLVPLTVLAVAGWLRPGSRAVGNLGGYGTAFTLGVVLAAGTLVVYSMRYYSGWQGRYLYAALVPACALLAGGWARWLPGRRPWVGPAGLGALLLAMDVTIAWKLDHFYTTVAPARWGLRLPL